MQIHVVHDRRRGVGHMGGRGTHLRERIRLNKPKGREWRDRLHEPSFVLLEQFGRSVVWLRDVSSGGILVEDREVQIHDVYYYLRLKTTKIGSVSVPTREDSTNFYLSPLFILSLNASFIRNASLNSIIGQVTPE